MAVDGAGQWLLMGRVSGGCVVKVAFRSGVGQVGRALVMEREGPV